MNRRTVVILMLLLIGCASHSWVSPQVDEIEGGDTRECELAGRCIDLVVAIDTSVSSVEKPGEGFSWGMMFRDAPDAGPGSKLWNALDGLDRALGAFDSERVGVSVIGFAGKPDSVEGAAWVEAKITNNFVAVEKAVSRIRARGAGGSSCHACAVRVAAALLSRAADEQRCPVLLVLADTELNLPYGPGFTADNQRQLARAFREAEIAGSTLVDLGPGDSERSQQLKDQLSEAGSRLVVASTSADVAIVITSAVEGCSR